MSTATDRRLSRWSRSEHQNAIDGRGLQQPHRDEKVIEELEAFVEQLGPCRRERLLALPDAAAGARQVGFLRLLRVVARHAG
jgi:hypothetical protein